MTEDKVHFVGAAGAGMSALAQFHAMNGGTATGSDRLADRGEITALSKAFSKLAIRMFPQDGTGIDEATRRIVASREAG